MASGKTIDRPAVRPRTNSAKAPASYLALIQRFPLRPITSESALDQASAMIHALLDRDDLDHAEADYLEVLSDLVERYEEKHHPIGDVSGGAMLRFLIDQKGVKQADVARGAGIAESTVSEVLAGRRPLNRTQIGKLARYFHVAPGVFLPES